MSLAEIEQDWSIDDMIDAHMILDAIDKAHRKPPGKERR